LDVLQRCIAMTEANRESVPGYYAQQLTEAIGEGAYDSEGHKNAQFLNATDVGPYLSECTRACKATRDEAIQNLGIKDDPDQKGWDKMGPLADPKPANEKNRGAVDRNKRRGEENRGEDEDSNAAHAPPATRADKSGEEAASA